MQLAAARIKLLPPQALLARLSRRLAILTSGTQDAPMRRQTLRNTLPSCTQTILPAFVSPGRPSLRFSGPVSTPSISTGMFAKALPLEYAKTGNENR